MFDGNFRARKEVNLSGRRRRSTADAPPSATAGNKQALLKNAEEQRRQRQEHQRRTQAARFVQRCTRGFMVRLHILEDLLPRAPQSLTATSHCVYYFRPWLFKKSTSTPKVLINYVRESVSSSTVTASVGDGGDDPMDVGSSHGSRSLAKDDSSWISQKRLILVTLRELSPNLSCDEKDLQALFTILQKYWPIFMSKRSPDDQLFLDLANCLSRWVHQNQENSATGVRATILQSLCQWAIQSCQRLTNPHSRALLASIMLSGSTELMASLPGDLYKDWVVPLALSLEQAATTIDLIQNATRTNLQNGKELKILSNLLQNDSQLLSKVQQQPQAILQIIYHVLTNAGDLALLASLLVRGDTLDVSKTASPVSNTNTTTGDFSDNMDDSDEEDYDDGEGTKEASTELSTVAPGSDYGLGAKKPRSTSRMSRKDLLTVPKLEKVYQDSIQQQKRDCKALVAGSLKPSYASTLAMAKKLVQAPWLTWGLQLLDSIDSDEGRRAGCLFVEALAILMKSTTSLRPKMKVGVMSPLAFNKPFLLKLWSYTVQCPSDSDESSAHKELALSVFCDLFAHYLVALSDVDFLKFHTQVEMDSSPSVTRGVLAPEVIETLRPALYELYWNRPVSVCDVGDQLPSGRLILAGTKVWNLLYERWNRLVRNSSFCDESAWWFPPLSSREGDGVVPTRERRETHHDDEDMDVDEDDSDDDGDQQMSAAEAETDALADAFRDPKMARILTCIPQALPFGRRVKLFHSLLKADKQKTAQAAASRRALMAMAGGDEDMFFDGIARERVRIRRDKLYEDSMEQLSELGTRLKHKVQVSFVNQHGAEEPGIDGGGVFKEFLDDLIKDGFASSSEGEDSSKTGAPPLFSVTPLQTLAVNYDMETDPQTLGHYQFLGRVLGKAVYESILVEPQFCLPFLNQLLGKTNSMEDLKNYDEEYYKNLNKLKLLNDAEVEALGLNFEVTVGGKTAGGSPRTVELMPGGRSIPVKTKAHIFQYMHAVANQLLNIQGAQQTKAFLRGFRDLIPASWVRLFSANELQNLISGDDSVRGIDVPSLKRAISYLGGYHPSQPYIQDFWDIIENELTPEQQRKFLRFMTSCSRQPLLGFGSLEPSPSIQQIRLNDDELSKNSRLPTSQTCFNLLKLPNYKSKALLKEKLLAAIESGAGFELT